MTVGTASVGTQVVSCDRKVHRPLHLPPRVFCFKRRAALQLFTCKRGDDPQHGCSATHIPARLERPPRVRRRRLPQALIYVDFSVTQCTRRISSAKLGYFLRHARASSQEGSSSGQALCVRRDLTERGVHRTPREARKVRFIKPVYT